MPDEIPDGYTLGKEMTDGDHYLHYEILERTVLGAYTPTRQCVNQHSARRRLLDLNAAYRLGWVQAMDAAKTGKVAP